MRRQRAGHQLGDQPPTRAEASITTVSSGTASTQASTRGPTSVGTTGHRARRGRRSPRSGSSSPAPRRGPRQPPATSRLARIGPVSTQAAAEHTRQVRFEAVLDHQPVKLEPGTSPTLSPAVATSARLPAHALELREHIARPATDRDRAPPARRGRTKESTRVLDPFRHRLSP